MNTRLPRQSIKYDPRVHAYAITMHRPTRAEAEIAYLRAANPELAGKVERVSTNVPELATRAPHAAFHLLANAVTLSQPGETVPSNVCNHPVLAHVRSKNGRYDHLLTRGDLGVVICSCPDATPESGDDAAPATRIAPHTCKHILAASFLIGS